MRRYIVNRLIIFIPVLLLVSIIVFSLIHLIPGDPIDVLFSEEVLTPENRAMHEKALEIGRAHV